jgi:cysteinyl-tRNA synthetase
MAFFFLLGPLLLSIYNTLTRQKAPFTPIHPPQVGMYVCGVTVYDYCHIGHARVMVVFDVMTRWLRASGYDLNFVRNITDIDDKIIKRAAENNESIEALTARFINAMHEDERSLRVLPPDHEPRATEHIDGMIAMIQTLLDKGFAYRTDKGDICYAVRQFEPYGALSGKSLDDLRAGERVSKDEDKRDPLDFVLWKFAKEGEPQWPAPFGAGRPGWHIECSAMCKAHLGGRFDIHGGGQDLQFPHHENEIAQSHAANGQAPVNVWIHNGFVTVDAEKMAKSLGNFRTIRDVLAKWSPEVLRLFLLRAHYRSPLHFSEEALADAKSSLTRLYQSLREVARLFPSDLDRNSLPAVDWQHPQAASFRQAMDDDFNTPVALSVLFDLAKEINRAKGSANADKALLRQSVTMLYSLASHLGILWHSPEDFFKQGNMDQAISDKKIEEMILERETYRKNKNFAEADRIRDELMDLGVLLDDSASGTTWKRL